MGIEDIYKGYREATSGLETSAQRERERITQEVATRQRELSAVEERELRKRDLPITRPSPEVLSSIAASREELKTAQSEALADIERQVKERQAEIDEWKDKADREYKEREKEREAEVKAIELKLAPYKTPDGYNIAKALEAGVTENFLVVEAGFSQKDIHDIKTATAKVEDISKKLKPFEIAGGYDITGALQAGITESYLLDAGFSKADINETKAFIAEQGAIVKKLAPYMTTYATAAEAYKAGVITMSEFMLWKNIELYPKGREGYTPLTTYDLSAALKADIPESFLIDAGFDKVEIAGIKAYDKALTDLKPYTDKEGKIDIVEALRAKAVTAKDLELVGIGDKAIKQAEHYSKIGKARTFWEGMTPWEEWKGEKVSVEGVGEMAAVMIVPGVWAKDWNEMDNKWRAINIAIDVAVLIPFVGWVARGGKIGLAGLRISSKAIRATAKTARVAGESQKALTSSLKAFQKAEMGAKGYAKLASDVQHLTYASRAADKAFADNIMKLTSVTPKQLAKFEKLSGMQGLKKSILEVGKTQKELDKAWSVASKFRVGSKPYIQELTKVQKAQAGLNTALGKFDRVMRPRVKLREATGWDRVMRPIEKELKQAEDEMGRLFQKQKAGEYIDPDYLKQVRSTVESLKADLANFKAAKAAGEMPPMPKGYVMKWAEIEKTSPERLLGDIEDFLSKRRAPPGIQQPLPLTPRAGKVTVKVAEKVKVEAPPRVSKLKLEPAYKPEIRPERAKVKAPSVFPGIKAKPKIYVKPTPTEIVGITAAEWSRMPIAAREKVLREVEVVAYEAVVIPATRGLTKAEQIAAVQAATRTAIRNAVKAITQGATKAEVEAQAKAALQPLTKVVPETKVKTLTKTIVKTTTKLTPKLRIRPKLRLRIWIPLPSGESRVLTEKEEEGIIAWKMGFMYKMIFPPYGQKQIVNSRKPLAGVKYYTGIGSAFKSIIARGGVVPRVVLRDMGIMDIRIETPKGSRKPTIHFKRDIHQRTRTTPGVSAVR